MNLYNISVSVDGGWTEYEFPQCSGNGTCGEDIVSKLKECKNPVPSKGGKECPCNMYNSLTYTELNCDGRSATVTKECLSLIHI